MLRRDTRKSVTRFLAVTGLVLSLGFGLSHTAQAAAAQTKKPVATSKKTVSYTHLTLPTILLV